MAKFTTRVLLHDAEDGGKEYETLHSAMELAGFSRTIESSGTTYHLPTAEYNLIGNYTKDNVRAIAQAAAHTTGRKAAILVTEGERCWIGLKKVQD